MDTPSTENYRNPKRDYREQTKRDMILLLRRMVELIGPKVNRIVADGIIIAICIFVMLKLSKMGDRRRFFGRFF
ncbi:hypothetical protein G1C98_1778 [Bifidobacterium sp. DSM 109960]|uniref:Uncharacterized protein n=1 Tax=Bifidobacterium erythrocebi TaxID=2675325 RepID=A0A7Y0EV79_9BIFI|nr:hypothetical protein [Bifidobacterium sp. DSM 109960]NMM97040.1 hypothetical protein [Bifidobacterium sp. DSM 109960]